MKVADLISLLQAMPPDAEVEAEGCDDVENATGVSLVDGKVCIRRDDGPYSRPFWGEVPIIRPV